MKNIGLKLILIGIGCLCFGIFIMTWPIGIGQRTDYIVPIIVLAAVFFIVGLFFPDKQVEEKFDRWQKRKNEETDRLRIYPKNDENKDK